MSTDPNALVIHFHDQAEAWLQDKVTTERVFRAIFEMATLDSMLKVDEAMKVAQVVKRTLLADLESLDTRPRCPTCRSPFADSNLRPWLAYGECSDFFHVEQDRITRDELRRLREDLS